MVSRYFILLTERKRRSEAAEENELQVWSWCVGKICHNGADKATENDPGGVTDVSSNDKLSRIFETPEENDGYKLWSFTWPNSILSAMLSFSIRERILSGTMTIKSGSTPDQLVATNSTRWWKASVTKQNSPKCTPTTASEPPQSPYGRMLV